MRTVTFSDDKVIDTLNRDFICVWRNIRSKEKYADVERGVKPDDFGAGSSNVCAFFATVDGKVAHAVQGYGDAAMFLRETDFARKALTIAGDPDPAKELSELYESRIATESLAKHRQRTLFDALQTRNLRILSFSPLPDLDPYWRAENQRAGLK